MNLKQELLEKVKNYNLTILHISLYKKEWDKEQFEGIAKCILDKEYDGDLSPLDFTYDNGFGWQEIYGTVYCKDANNRPAWLTRQAYDGSEWFQINYIPDYYYKYGERE